MQAFQNRQLTIFAPIALIALAVIAAVWLDARTGGDAEPPPLLGAVGTPVRGTYVPPTATPPGFEPTPLPRQTGVIPPTAPGTASERDDRRRADALIILDAFARWHEEEGSYPGTGGNVQSLCVFRGVDVGCQLKDVLGEDPPSDPFGNSSENGYWYQSDGETGRIYLEFEGDLLDSERCRTEYEGFKDRPNMLCLELP
jgi:hypothetical protein